MGAERFRNLVLDRESLSLLAVVLLIDTLLLILAALWYYPRIVNVDGLYSSQVARNLVAGRGYTTSEMTLYEVNLYFHKGWLNLGPPWPNSGRFPLPVIVRAFLFLIVGDNYLVATYLYSMTFQVISVAAVFVVSLYLFREKSTAFFSAIFFVASPILLFAGINGKETTSDFLLFTIGIALIYRWRKADQPRLSQLFILGLVVGLTYLNRFNLGGIVLLSLVPLVLKDAFTKRFPLRSLSRMVVSFAAGFGTISAPLFVYNALTFGNPSFSSNSLFQFVQFSAADKYMNPWWKVSYPFDTANPFSALGMFSNSIISRTVSITIGSFNDFLYIGAAGTGFSWFWWIPIAFSAFVLAWPKLSGGSSFPLATSDQIEAASLLSYIVIFNLLLDFPVLGVFSAGVEYVWYVYTALAIFAGFGLTRILGLLQEQSLNILDFLKKYRRLQNLPTHLTNKRLGVLLFGVTILAGIIILGVLPTSSGINETEVQLIALAVSGPASLAAFRYWKKALPAVLIALVLATPIIRYGFIGANGSPEMVPNWITDQDSSVFQLITSIVPANGVVLSAEPWNVAWWSDRSSVAFSEFPDEIYLMMGVYKMNVQAVYIANLNSVFFRDIHAPYTYEAYRRIAYYNYTINGFHFAMQGFSEGEPSILLVRDRVFDPSSLLDTRLIDFGNASDSSHLVWGWSQIVQYNGTTAAWAYRPGALPLNEDPRFGILSCLPEFEQVSGRCLPMLTINSGGQTSSIGYPDAEVTFLSQNTDARVLQMRVLSPVPNQRLSLTLNSNLLYFGQSGASLGSFSISTPNTWLNLNITVPKGEANVGLNLLSFAFSQTAGCSSQGPSGQCGLLVSKLSIS